MSSEINSYGAYMPMYGRTGMEPGPTPSQSQQGLPAAPAADTGFRPQDLPTQSPQLPEVEEPGLTSQERVRQLENIPGDVDRTGPDELVTFSEAMALRQGANSAPDAPVAPPQQGMSPDGMPSPPSAGAEQSVRPSTLSDSASPGEEMREQTDLPGGIRNDVSPADADDFVTGAGTTAVAGNAPAPVENMPPAGGMTSPPTGAQGGDPDSELKTQSASVNASESAAGEGRGRVDLPSGMPVDFSSAGNVNGGVVTGAEATVVTGEMPEDADGLPPAGMMPPSPPSEDTGFTEAELSEQLASLTSAESPSEEDSARAELLTNILSDFAAADSDGDGRISFSEAMGVNPSEVSANEAGTRSASMSVEEMAATTADPLLMRRILQLGEAYGTGERAASQSTGGVSLLA